MARTTKTPQPTSQRRSGQQIASWGEPMQVDRQRLYRVRAVAELVDVSMSTVYRAIENGQLDVLRIGKALRVPGPALAQWLTSCGCTTGVSGHGQDEVQ